MNSIKNFGLKFAMILVALICANVAFAQDQIKATLKIPNQGINNYETKWIPVYLNNEDPVAALQFRFSLPEELEFADGENTEPKLNYDRLVKNNHVVAMNLKTGMILLQSLNLKDIKDGEGPIMEIPVKVKEGMLASGKTVEIVISKIEFSNGNGTASGTQANFNVPVMLEPFTYTAYLTPNPLAIYPESSQKVNFCLKNVYTNSDEEAPVVGLTFKMALPAGLEVDPETIEINTDRVFNRTIVSYKNGKFMLDDVSQNNPLKSGSSDGVLFSFDLKASKDYVANDAKIVLSDLEVSAVVGAYAVEGVCEDCALVNTATLAANKAAYDKAIETIEALQAKYDEALAAVKEANPDYDFSEWEELITTAINQAKEGASQAYASATEDGGEFVFPFDGADIEAMIEEMKNAPAKSALENANQLAYDKVIETLDALDIKYAEALAAAKDEYPEFDFSDFEEIITNAIKEAREGAAQNLAAANEEGVEFNFPFDGADIEAMIEEMKNAPAKAALEAANKAAYDEVIAVLDELQAKFEAAVAEVNETYPEFDAAEYEEIISGAISQAREGAAQALETANEEGEEFNFASGAEDIEAMIEEMKAQAKAEADQAALEAANKAAYDQVIATLEAVEAELAAAVAEVEKDYPDFDLTEWKEIISGQINEQKEGAAQALKAANEDGVEFNYPFDGGEYILGMIEEMKNAAKADADQAALEAANLEACNKVLESIDALQDEFEAAVADINEKNPGFETSEWEEIIMGAINEAREAAAQALESANEDGVEYNFAFDGSDIKAMIEQMVSEAATTAVDAIAAEVAAGKAYIFTLDGKKHNRPVVGEVNVIVRENSTSKIFIK